MSSSDSSEPVQLLQIQRELELLYQAHSAQAARIAALEGEVFLLRQRVRELVERSVKDTSGCPTRQTVLGQT